MLDLNIKVELRGIVKDYLDYLRDKNDMKRGRAGSGGDGGGAHTPTPLPNNNGASFETISVPTNIVSKIDRSEGLIRYSEDSLQYAKDTDGVLINIDDNSIEALSDRPGFSMINSKAKLDSKQVSFIGFINDNSKCVIVFDEVGGLAAGGQLLSEQLRGKQSFNGIVIEKCFKQIISDVNDFIIDVDFNTKSGVIKVDNTKNREFSHFSADIEVNNNGLFKLVNPFTLNGRDLELTGEFKGNSGVIGVFCTENGENYAGFVGERIHPPVGEGK